MKLKNVVLIFLLGHLLLLMGCKESPINVPAIYSFKPTSAKVDSLITIHGKNFSTTNSLVNINGFTCPIVSSSVDKIVIKAVPGVSTGILSVTVDNLAAIAHDEFTLIPHEIDSVAPLSGTVGDIINFSGINFCDNASDIQVIFYSDESIDPVAVMNYIPEGVDTTATFSVMVPAKAATGKIIVKIGAVEVKSKYDFEIE